jgi:hypothetical protein
LLAPENRYTTKNAKEHEDRKMLVSFGRLRALDG